MDATIEVTGVRKRFGPAMALDGLSFTVTPGHVTGLAGPNGAGKSTTMRVILGLAAADGGAALVSGRPYRSLRHPLNHPARCWTRRPCTLAGAAVTTCCGWRIHRASPRGGRMK
jgi:ABC-type branched-subunit amino acid transport system ATPase component